MKSILVFLAMVLLVTPVLAGPVVPGDVNIANGGSSHVDTDVNVGNGLGNFSPKATATIERGAVDIDNKNINVQGQNQDQNQKQIQGQGQSMSNTIKNTGNTNQTAGNITIETPRDFLAIPGVGVYVPSMIPGAVSDVTAMLFLPVGLKRMTGNEAYVETISFNGNIFDRICLEDLSQDILKHFRKLSGTWAEESQIRVRVWVKSKTTGWGGSSGGNGTMSGFNGPSTGVGGGIAGLIGYNSSTYDPEYVIEFFRVSYSKK
jgi:hypothetical protein